MLWCLQKERGWGRGRRGRTWVDGGGWRKVDGGGGRKVDGGGCDDDGGRGDELG